MMNDPPPPPGPDPAARSPLHVLLVGCGKIALHGHLPALAELQAEGLVRVVACDADPARAEQMGTKFGIPWVTEWKAAAADADAVSVCLPPGPNAEVAAQAVAMGRHVVCEKPPGRNISQAIALAQAAAERPEVVTMVAFNRRFNPLYRRAIAQSLELGPPTSFYGRFSMSGLGSPPEDTVEDWITSSSSHALDLAMATMGFPSAVSVSRRRLGAGPDNVWTVQMHSAAGSSLLLFNYAAGRRVERYEWAGAGYDVALDLPKAAEWAQSGRKVETWNPENGAYHHSSGFAGEYRAFLDAIRGVGARPACDFSYAPAFMRLVEVLLGASDATLLAVPPLTERRPVPVASPAPSAESSRGDDRGSPVVLVQQAFSTHGRFFDVASMTALKDKCDVRILGSSPDTTEEDERAWKEAQVVITGRGTKGLPPDVLTRSPNLELVMVLGASVRNFSAQELLERCVTVCNTADAVAQSVAEYCLMVALAGLRNLPRTDQAMHRGEWPRPGGIGAVGGEIGARLREAVRQQPAPPQLRRLLKLVDDLAHRLLGKRAGSVTSSQALADLRGAVVGIVGWGATAQRFVELLQPFQCDVLVATDAASSQQLAAAGARRAALSELLASAKVISLHKGLTGETRGFLNERHLALIRPGSVLVNAARGELIDEPALLNRLAAGDIVAALDVYSQEPLPKNHPIRRLPNVILTPHHASTTAGEERRMGEQAIRTILAWAGGEPVAGVDTARLAKMT